MLRQNILIIILGLCLIGIIFVWYNYLSVAAPEPAEVVTNLYEEELIEIRRLKDLTLDTKILEDEFFRSLQAPPTVDITNLAAGRENPFAPF